MNTLSNGIANIFTEAILSILGLLVTYFVTVAVSYLKQKKEALIKQIGAEQYNSTYNIGKSVYYAVEQQFKFVPAAGVNKRELFDKMLLEKIPSLQKEELDHFREAIVGEINTQIEQSKLFEAAPIFNPEIDEADIKIIE